MQPEHGATCRKTASRSEGGGGLMPIRSQHRRLYPFDWPQLSKSIRFGPAGGRCECCARPHGQTVTCTADGRWLDGDVWRNGKEKKVVMPNVEMRTTKVFLATAHLDHHPTNNRGRNLKALGQRCHMLHDRYEHHRRRWLALRARKALGDLFLGAY